MSLGNLSTDLSEAEKKARQRDFENEVDLNIVQEQERKANEIGYGLYKLNTKNQAKFAQVIKENMFVLVKNKYLTGGEFGFLAIIQPLIEYQVNAISDPYTNEFMTVSDIAKYAGRSRQSVSPIIQSLINKGILFEFVNAKDLKMFNRNVKPRTLFVNPEIYYCGDKNKIDGTLTKLVSHNDELEKAGIKLGWKVWKEPGRTFGKLYKRKTYLKLRNKK